MLIVNSQEMRELDREATARYGVSSATLMENAGRAVAEWLTSHYRHRLTQRSSIYVLCGPGNNGGDGRIAARVLTERGYRVSVLGSDARTFSKFPRAMRDDIIVDALLGTGLSRPPKGVIAEAIQWANRSKVPIVAVDIPSGLSADTGRALGPVIRADSTVTFQVAKQGHVLYPGCELSGTLHVADIGIPPLLIKQKKIKRHVLAAFEIGRLLKPRVKDSHKGSYGHALVIGGEFGKIGAGILSARAFLRSGGGLASFVLPEMSYDRIDPDLLELMYIPIKTRTPYLNEELVSQILPHLEGKSIAVLGPGLGDNAHTQAFVRSFLKKVHIPVVLDADGLNCAAKQLEILEHHRGRLVLTPHPGEMARLTGLKISEIQEKRIDHAQAFAEKYGVYLVLKGYRSIIATPQGEVLVNPTGNPGMATAGMGDVLAGVIAAFIAQGYAMKNAVAMAVFCHGLCGDVLRDEKGERGMLAHDVIEKMPLVLHDLATSFPPLKIKGGLP